jgi:hypothetical protein
MKHTIDTDVRFSIVPEWVLYAEVSDKAVRLYSILARYADNETLEAFPSRELLAKRANCHAKSVDRAIQELADIGAITKTHRKSGNGFQSNVYTLRRVPPHMSPPRDTTVEGVGTPVSPPRDTDVHLTRTTELEPEELEPLNNQTSVIESFDEFWDTYPKHLQKGEARKAFFKAVQRVGDVDTILEGARRMSADPNLPVKQFIPYPATWLNRDGWDDEPFPPRDGIPGVTQGMPKSPHVGGPREWVKDMHDMGEHWECRPGEFGCK